MRYIRFQNAAVAIEYKPAAAIEAPREPSPATQTFWALNPLRGRLGTYAAIRLKGSRMWVGVRTSTALVWVKADLALTRSEAATWFPRAHFSR